MAKRVSSPMMVARSPRSIDAMLSAEIGGAGIPDSPEPGRSGTRSMKSRSSAAILRTQCIQLPLPPCSSTSGSSWPQMRHTTSPAPLCVVERVRHGEVAREVLEHRGLPGVDAVHRQKSIVGLRRRLGLELGRDDVEYIIEMVRQTKPPQHSGNVAACAVGEDEFAAGKLFNR